jgi:signal transduction histidine kinase
VKSQPGNSVAVDAEPCWPLNAPRSGGGRSRRSPRPLESGHGAAGRLLAAWLAVLAAGWTVAGILAYAQLSSGFQADARTLHRVVSQRADQHDAFLTSVSAVLVSPDASPAVARAVAEAVQRFYPRITAVEAVAAGSGLHDPLATKAPFPGNPVPDTVRQTLQGLAPGQSGLVRPACGGPGHYVLVKRLLPTVADAEALVMRVDAGRLVEPEMPLTPGATLTLSDPQGRPCFQSQAGRAGASVLPPLVFEAVLGSRSQPLVLRLARAPGLAEVLPPAALLLVALSGTLALGVAALLLRERRVAREAVRRARLGEHEVRLAHAMRVNAVGEMASGIAHELAQPLTAVLSQSQAGLRLAQAAPATPEAVTGVLEANVRHAKRAGAILSRLHAYVSRREPEPRPTALNACAQSVAELVRRDLDERGVPLVLELGMPEPWCLADPISIEQVVHNLIRNAVDAVRNLPEARRTICVSTAVEGRDAVVRVADDGPGIAPEHLPRLFEPFFTTKPDGMGLGLPLCERLVEAAGGRILAASRPGAGTTLTIRLPVVACPARTTA